MSDAMPVRRVARARIVLAGTVLAAAVLWSLAAGLGVIAFLGLASLAGMRVGGTPAELLALAAGLGTVGVALWRGRAVWSLERVALWLEEQTPELKYTLVTVVDLVVDPRYALAAPYVAAEADGDAVFRGRAARLDATLLAAANRADLERVVRRSAGRTLMVALAAVLLTGGAVRLLHATDRFRAFGHASRLARHVPPLGNRLAKLRAEVVPPAYSGLPRQVVADPTNVAALVGTTIRFLGDGPPDGVTAIVDRDTIARDTVAARAVGAGRGDGWAVPVPMPALPGLVRFRDRTYHRSVVLEPLVDSVPRVLLRAPAHDTTWRWDQPPRGDLVLEAELEDDYGLDNAYFEILVSTGGAENFETKDKSTVRVRFGGQKHATLRATVPYAALGVVQGTVIHVRAVAYDNNTVADSAGKGVSETRTLRMATKAEADTVSVTAAAPLPIDSLWMGQRVLNARTDTLIRLRRPKLTNAQYQDTSIFFGTKQQAIQGRVEEIILILEDDGVGGRQETEASRLLRQATDQMYQARQYLAIGMPDSAYVPPKSYMKEALRLLDLARMAHKYYLRGKLQTRPVDVAAARLKGDSGLVGHAGARTARPIPEDLRRALRSRLAAVVSYVLGAPGTAMSPGTVPEGAIDSLMRLRTVALRGAPMVATALQAAIAAAHEGKSVALPDALARAQRLLDPPPRLTAGPAEWGGLLP